jgi:hypothetical protein
MRRVFTADSFVIHVEAPRLHAGLLQAKACDNAETERLA